MARAARKTAILAKIEPVYGTDAVPTGAANAVLVSNLQPNPLNAQNVPRDLIRSFFGNSEDLVGNAFVELGFDVEIAGSGAAGTAPAWGPLLRACAFAEVVSAGVSVDYTPITDNIESLTMYYHRDGVLHKLLGARGNASLNLGVGNRPVFSFRFIGLDGGIAAVADPSQTLTPWKTPLAVTAANTSNLLIGCSYAAGALSGGTAYPSTGPELELGNALEHIPMLGDESVDINDRKTSGKVMLDLSAAQEVAFMAKVKANEVDSMGIVHGTTAGNKVLVYMPAVQLINPRHENYKGRALCGYDLKINPLNGNDELRIASL